MFKSHAQRDRCERLVKEGKMTPEQFEKYHKSTDYEKLPKRIHPKKKEKK